MPRKKKVPVFAPPAWRQTLKTKFLAAAFQNCSEAGNLLATDARDGKINEHDWAERFNVAGTWVERWANDVLETWREVPYTFPTWPPPRDESTEADGFSFSIVDARPSCKFSLGVLVGGSLPDGAEEDDWEPSKRDYTLISMSH